MDRRLSGTIRPYELEIAWLERLIDMAIVAGCLWLALRVYAYPWQEQYTALAYVAVGLFYAASTLCNVYRSWRLERLPVQAAQVLVAWVSVTFCVLLAGYVTKTTHDYSRLAVSTWLLVTPAVLVLWRAAQRLALRKVRQFGYNSRGAAIVGTGEMAGRVASTIFASPELGLRLLGFYDDRKPPRIEVPAGVESPLLGGHDELLASAQRGDVDVIYITYPLHAQNRVRDVIKRFSDTTASVYAVPDMFLFDLFQGRWAQIGSLPAISVYETPFYGLNALTKRLIDIIVASLILVAITLPMLAIAIAVRLSSPGPILFKQRRYGLDGRPFRIWKFRTMTVEEDGDVVRQATRSDPRVTPIGAFLRRTSLDELPQFFNVLFGNMSIVGPRPHALAHNEHYRTRILAYMMRHKVKPGITGWAQVNGFRGETRDQELMEKRVQFDLWYIRNWSVWLDLKIIIKTMLVVLRQSGAH